MRPYNHMPTLCLDGTMLVPGTWLTSLRPPGSHALFQLHDRAYGFVASQDPDWKNRVELTASGQTSRQHYPRVVRLVRPKPFLGFEYIDGLYTYLDGEFHRLGDVPEPIDETLFQTLLPGHPPEGGSFSSRDTGR